MSHDVRVHGYFTKPKKFREQKRLGNNVSEYSFRTTQLTLSGSITKAITLIL
jgi:hypothetical protein